jgi:hypothetical protein
VAIVVRIKSTYLLLELTENLRTNVQGTFLANEVESSHSSEPLVLRDRLKQHNDKALEEPEKIFRALTSLMKASELHSRES